MSKPTVQICNARSGTVSITDDAAVEASQLAPRSPAADAIPVPLEPTSPAQPKGKYKGKGKGKGEMKGGSSDVGQGLPVDAEWARARAWARSRSPPRIREIAPTPTCGHRSGSSTCDLCRFDPRLYYPVVMTAEDHIAFEAMLADDAT